MTRETRIALLIGLAFIVLFGWVLGRRNASLSSADPVAQGPSAPTAPSVPRPATELATGHIGDVSDRPALEGLHATGEGTHDSSRPPVTPPPVPGPDVRVVVDDHGDGATPPPAVGPDRPASPPPTDSRAAVPPGSKPYTVVAGDSFIKIANKVYGKANEKEFARIAEANKDKVSSPNKLAVGMVLVVPPLDAAAPAPADRRGGAEELTTDELRRRLSGTDDGRILPEDRRAILPEEARRPLTGVKSYVVRAGDNPSNIARREMGTDSKSAVDKLMEANKDVIKDPSKLKVGMTIRIPTT